MQNEEESKEEAPITMETYCFMHYVDDRFYTLMLSYLVPFFIENHNKIEFTAEVGEHKFFWKSDQPVYLIPYDHPKAQELGIAKIAVNISVGDAPMVITIPMELPKEILPFITFKMADNKLFKAENNQWIQMQL